MGIGKGKYRVVERVGGFENVLVRGRKSREISGKFNLT
jgi:hypothetical protein